MLLKQNKKFEVYNKYIIKKLPKNWGNIIGGKKRYNQLIEEGKFKQHHKIMIINKMKKIKSKRIKLPKKSRYFIFIKKQNIPLKPLLQTMLFTDGHINEKKNLIFYTSKSFELINIFCDIILEFCKNKPRILLRRGNMYEFYLYDPNLVKLLLSLSPTYTTKVDSKPSLEFISKQSNKTLIECLRLAMTTDGCIVMAQERKNSFKIRPKLVFSCFNERLLKEWQEIFNRVDFDSYLIKKNNKYIGLITTNINILKKFYYYGGFIEGVKISKKSKRFNGYNKNDLLKISLNINQFHSWKELKQKLELKGPVAQLGSNF